MNEYKHGTYGNVHAVGTKVSANSQSANAVHKIHVTGLAGLGRKQPGFFLKGRKCFYNIIPA